MPPSRSQKRRRQASARAAGVGDEPGLLKAPSGVEGLDEITGGGLPRGRPTLLCGGAGCGKTLFAMGFLVRGASEYGEPGVFMSFEETPEELAANVASLGFDVKKLEAQKKLAIDFVRVRSNRFPFFPAAPVFYWPLPGRREAFLPDGLPRCHNSCQLPPE